MSRIVQAVTINRPPRDVWAYITDFARGPEWIPGQVEKQALTPEPYGRGTRIRAVQKVPGRIVEGTFEIAEWQPSQRLVERSVDGALQVQVAYDLDPEAASGSRLTLTYDIAGRRLYKLVELLTARSIRGSLPNACATLKRKIESKQAAAL
jgi:uncharacterized membrane protein